MAMLIPIGNNHIRSADLSDAYNKLPVNYGLVNSLGIFQTRGVMTTVVNLEENEGKLQLVQNQPRTGPFNPNLRGRRTMRSFEVPYYPLQDIITATDIQNIRAFGSENALEAYSQVTNDHLTEMRMKHEITREHQRTHALQGDILNAEGTSILNLFTAFGITQTSVDFVLGTATTDTLAKCGEAVDAIRDGIGGDMATGYIGLASRGFYDKLFGHEFTRGTFQFSNYQSQVLRSDMGVSRTPYGDIDWMVYIGNAINPVTGTASPFLTADEAIVFPTGTQQTFREYAAPGNMVDIANTLGQPFYARQEIKTLGLGVDLHAEMSVLNVCMRPQVLIRCHTSN